VPALLERTVERYGRELPENGDAVLQINKATVTTPNCSSRGNQTHLSPLTPPAIENTSPESQSLVTSSATEDGFANSSHPFSLLQGDWIQLSPLGDFPHGQGIQRVDPESLAAITGQFNSLFARLGRLFVGVPFYIGHPDVPALAREYRTAKPTAGLPRWKRAKPALSPK